MPKIVEITVTGNKYINRESIVAASGLTIGEPLTQDVLNQAQRNLVLTQNYGWNHPEDPDAGVKVTAVITGTEGRVTIAVDENDKVLGINITDTGPIPAAEIKQLLQTRVGYVLNAGTLRTDTERVTKYYQDHGYQAAFGDVTFKNGILTLPVIVAKVGKITITGLHKTRPYVVLREMKTKKGSFYNTTVLTKDIQNVYNTQLFDDIVPSVSTPAIGVEDITLSMKEKRTGNVVLGVGYSSTQSLVGHAEIGDTNFLGTGQQLNLMWEAGGTANRNSAEITYVQPWIDNQHTSLSLDLYDKTIYRFGTGLTSLSGTTSSISDNYYEQHAGGAVTVSRPFGDTYRGHVGVRYDDVRVPLLSLNLSDTVVLQNGPLIALSTGMTHDTRDYVADPASGGLESYSADIGHADLSAVGTVNGEEPLGTFGKVMYEKLYIDLRRYISVEGPRTNPKQRRHVFAFRLSLGSSLGTLPFSEQYFVGGAESLRGYRDDRFWGSHMFLSSVEYRVPLANALTGVLFTDVGDAWGGSYEHATIAGFTQHSTFSPRVGIGFGLRVVTPIGPIRIDEGFGSEGSRLHFSIGQAF